MSTAPEDEEQALALDRLAEALALPEREPPHCSTCHCGSECPECARLRDQLSILKEEAHWQKMRLDSAFADRDREKARADALQKIVDGCPEPTPVTGTDEAWTYYRDHILPAQSKGGGE